MSSSLVFVASMCLLWGGETKSREVVILQIRIVEGDGLVHTAESRSPKSLTLQISDETGTPVEGATVSFRLPDEGAGGFFRNGLRTEIMVTGPDGLASVKGIKCNSTAGPFEIRAVAAKDRARAGIVIPQYLSAKK
jgi:hypothetical protein